MIKTLVENDKYARLEIERRWKVDPERLPDLSALKRIRIRDKYLTGTRLRLRRMEYIDQGVTHYKLCKKYGKTSDHVEPMTNFYLERSEYEILDGLPGKAIAKDRFPFEFEGQPFSIDRYGEPHAGLYTVEIEFRSEDAAREASPPPFALEEVSADPRFAGSFLAGVQAAPADADSTFPVDRRMAERYRRGTTNSNPRRRR